ncbi:MAG: hypothetical protein D8M59_14470 [Planctomycetes bacterium]|nr:hypothetical protein [Planctomycetota bacterium]
MGRFDHACEMLMAVHMEWRQVLIEQRTNPDALTKIGVIDLMARGREAMDELETATLEIIHVATAHDIDTAAHEDLLAGLSDAIEVVMTDGPSPIFRKVSEAQASTRRLKARQAACVASNPLPGNPQSMSEVEDGNYGGAGTRQPAIPKSTQQGMLCAQELMAHFGIKIEKASAFRKALERWRPSHGNSEWIEIPPSYRTKRSSKYLYRVDAVRRIADKYVE